MLSFGLIKRAVLELINQATIAGAEVPLSYNNQADYVRRIPNLINQAVMKIRTTLKPDLRTAELSDGERGDGGTLYPLPPDCRALVSGGVWRGTAGDSQAGERHFPMERTNDYRLMGRSILILSPDGGPKPRYFVEYQAYPVQLPADPGDEFRLEETPEVIQAAEYYAAAQLIMMEDEFSYASLMNEYESRLAAMAPPPAAQVHPVRDVYGFVGT